MQKVSKMLPPVVCSRILSQGKINVFGHPDLFEANAVADLKSPTAIWIKGWMFLFLGFVATALLLFNAPKLSVLALHCIAVWAFCRFYYFAFYVIEHYVDDTYRFAGLTAFVQYALRKRKQQNKTSDS